ncbi:hypothetical protein [Brevibacillus borstelensis]|uniref:hypothetical protein n=1 Tax=Brevibacillus borstelensis TaxID=45462 RepID=UPI0030C18C7C
MAKGGKRAGAGRKAQGITRKISLTLTAEEWAEIEKDGGTVADFVRRLMRQPKQSDDSMVSAYWKEDAEKYRMEVMEKVEEIAVLKHELEKSNQNQKVERLTSRDVEQLWQIHLEKGGQHTPKTLEKAHDALFRNLFPGGSELTEIKTQPQYICPFTNKRFSTPGSLIRAAIPRLISSAEKNLKDRQAAEERQRAKEEDERNWKQLVSEGKMPDYRIR